MRVLKYGTGRRFKPLLAVCQHCTSELEFTADEAQRLGDLGGDIYRLRCPVCNRSTDTRVPVPTIEIWGPDRVTVYRNYTFKDQ